MNFVVLLVDHVAAGLGVLRFDKPLAGREHASADVVARLDNRHFGAPRRQIARSTQTGEAPARAYEIEVASAPEVVLPNESYV